MRAATHAQALPLRRALPLTCLTAHARRGGARLLLPLPPLALAAASAPGGGACAAVAARSLLLPKLREDSGRLRPALSAEGADPPPPSPALPGFRLAARRSAGLRSLLPSGGAAPPPCPCCATTGAAASASTPKPIRRVGESGGKGGGGGSGGYLPHCLPPPPPSSFRFEGCEGGRPGGGLRGVCGLCAGPGWLLPAETPRVFTRWFLSLVGGWPCVVKRCCGLQPDRETRPGWGSSLRWGGAGLAVRWALRGWKDGGVRGRRRGAVLQGAGLGSKGGDGGP